MQKIDNFELLEAADGSFMLSLPLLEKTGESLILLLLIENKELFLCFDMKEADYVLSPFPKVLLEKIKNLPELLVAEFSDNGLARAFEAPIQILD